MLSAKDNELMCRVGPGTEMGAVMREYWIPALLSSELPAPDCPPTRLRLLGENLIAFRTTSGQVGVVVDACPHRGASMFFGRNEEEGLRCVYHGWKFDVNGTCVDMPSEPAESNFKTKVRIRAYSASERNNVIWLYMGSRGEPPPLPDLEANMLPEGSYMVEKRYRECNWVQALEGDIDTSHLGFLHLGALRPEEAPLGSFDYYTVADRAPKYLVRDTEFGTSYGAYRPAEEDTYYWRTAHFLFPFYTMIPTGVLGVQILARAWVPIDDENTMFWNMGAPSTRGNGQGSRSEVRTETQGPAPGARSPYGLRPDSTEWLGKFRLVQNKVNDYMIDRENQRSVTYTGIQGIFEQDQAVTESMGVIYNRTDERLGTSDAMVIRTRRRLIGAARALRDHGELPPGVDDPEVYRYRSGGVILPRSVDYVDATKRLLKAFVEHKPEEVFEPSIPVEGS